VPNSSARQVRVLLMVVPRVVDVDGLNPEANPGAPSTRATPALALP
jgi:hypothetical protein